LPNTIHAYDASILIEIIKEARRLKIKLITIHDAIGAQLVFAPIIKILYKIINIKILLNEGESFPNIKIDEKTKREFEEIITKEVPKSTKYFK